MQKITVLTVILNLLTLFSFSQTITPIPDWTVTKQTDAKILITQSIINNSNSVIYQVRKQATINEDIADWFNNTVTSDMQKEKWMEKQKGSLQESNNVYIYVTEMTDASTKRWYVLYLAHGFGKKQVRFARVTGTPQLDFFQTNSTVATQHFARLAMQDRNNNTAIGESEKTLPVVSEKETITNPQKPPAKLNLVQNEKIHSTIMHLEYEAGMGGAIYPVYNPYILYKDGSIYKDPVEGLNIFDAATSRTAEPKKWGTWKMSGTALNIYWPLEKPKYQNSTWEKSSYYNIVPAKKSETLEGSFKTLTGGGNTALGGDVLVVAAATITFSNDGKFTLAKVAGVSSGRDIWENTNSNADEAGYYKLDQYSIELKYNNGKTENRFFYFYPDSRKHFGIAGSVYMPKSK
jgi:hypothetical protein